MDNAANTHHLLFGRRIVMEFLSKITSMMQLNFVLKRWHAVLEKYTKDLLQED